MQPKCYGRTKTNKTMFGKGRCKHANYPWGYSAQTTFLADSCWEMNNLGAKIDANTYQKLMQKQVPTTLSMKNIKSHDFLMWQNIENHRKHMFLEI